MLLNVSCNIWKLIIPLLMATFLFFDCVYAGGLVQIQFSPNPSGIRVYEYVPSKVASKPAILVANHWCGGSASAMYQGSKYAQLADQNGFIVLYPEMTRSDKCWDVYSAKGLKRDGGSDSQGIVAAIRAEIQARNGDSGRVYVTGLSSGAMMTNVLLAEYPDIFQAGSAFAGVPYTCFRTSASGPGTNTWNSTCSAGNVNLSAQQWGDLARAGYPGYSGRRPRMQLWHGTADDTLNYRNMQEELEQWTNVLGISANPVYTDNPNAQDGVQLTRRRYGNSGGQPPVETITMEGFGHNVNVGAGNLKADMALRFMGLIP